MMIPIIVTVIVTVIVVVIVMTIVTMIIAIIVAIIAAAWFFTKWILQAPHHILKPIDVWIQIEFSIKSRLETLASDLNLLGRDWNDNVILFYEQTVAHAVGELPQVDV